MTNIKESFKKIMHREPKVEELNKFYEIKDSLNIKDNDALWSIVFLLEHYLTMYKDIPDEIKNVVKTSSHKAAQLAENTVKTELQKVETEIKQQLTTIINDASEDFNRQITKRSNSISSIILAIGALIIAIAFFINFTIGSHILYALNNKIISIKEYIESSAVIISLGFLLPFFTLWLCIMDYHNEFKKPLWIFTIMMIIFYIIIGIKSISWMFN